MPLTLNFGDKIKKIKQEGCVHVFGVNVDPAGLKQATDAALVRLQAVVSIPGFRAGKVPLAMIKAQFPSMVKDEVLDIAAKAAMPEILKAGEVMPVVTPLMKNVSYEVEKNLYFEVQLECNPQVAPRDYEKIPVTRRTKIVTDADVAKYIDQVREYNAYLRPVEDGKPVEKTHFVIVNYEPYENGVKVADGVVNGEIVDMSSPQTIAGLADNIVGAKKGEIREFASEFGEKKMTFRVTVAEIKQKIVPALDEAFLNEAGVKTVDELRGNVRKLLERGETEKTEKDVMTQLEDALLKGNPMQLPPTLVKEEAHELFEILKKRVSSGQEVQEDALMERLRPAAERNLSMTYLLHNIARKENISATEAELAAELEKVTARLNTEEEKKKARELFEKRKDYIMASIVENKTMDFIKSKAVIKEESK
ncbi:MAG: trigger factor [Elusimicrobia bacterium GWA2_56_46]|nr:MAG: trigger factor [Elusimicrobia bacterium GWA2_56_46]OGR54066.1 MAG: trigger factor [Elusimicrobia bacterium GWC2_56_31]HBW22990.1 trigger factor [Elusimicrobiota bacterium]